MNETGHVPKIADSIITILEKKIPGIDISALLAKNPTVATMLANITTKHEIELHLALIRAMIETPTAANDERFKLAA